VTVADLATGARVGRYVVVERVGTGAMGVVYGAYDPELDRKIALKLLKPEQGAKETARARLLREAKAMGRLSHPNVVAVHDVGVYEEQVFLAMEFLNGGTIKSWLAERPRGWREILRVFVAAGRGLVAAHAAGLVHRDFKPDNVLLDREGRPRVVDFGIARQADGAAEEPADAELPATLRESDAHALLTLTKTGAMVGTPAYMAPEQFMGERGDELSDQFSFCVALYEALYGERPFAGDDLVSLSVNVAQGELRPVPKDRAVPAWLRRTILRGIKPDRAARWPSMAALIATLEDDPAVKLRRRLVGGGAIAAIAATLLIASQIVGRRRAEGERQIAQRVADAEQNAAAARSKVVESRALRDRAYAAYDAFDSEQGEPLWKQTRALLPIIDAAYDRASQSLEAALTLDASRDDLRARLGDLRFEHLLFAEEFRMEAKAQLLAERLVAVDADGSRRKRFDEPGTIAVRTTPGAARVVLERYERDPATGRRAAKPIATLSGAEPERPLPQGSYRLALDGPGLARVLYPFEVRRGERRVIDLALPRLTSVPAGFVYVPPGEFWFGDGDELLRSQFLRTAPIHQRHTDGYLISRYETTYAEWIAFLDAQPPATRARSLPDVSVTTRGSLRLRPLEEGGWQFTFQPGDTRYTARAGEPINYVGRKLRARQDWRRFPVAGISLAEIETYLGWLRATGRVPGARLCTEVEWERAARGADDRLFPHGDELQPEEANIDATYGRVDSAYGPDEVGSHPGSQSPFGVDDLAGNVFDLVTSSLARNETVIKGGAYFFQPINSRSTNREPVPSTYRDVATGIRVCAPAPEGS
jgi:formylglycine-generating enzyme required for sulfatase activity/tRNA A-37 threonylcarbamoyl transferase component Bud32